MVEEEMLEDKQLLMDGAEIFVEFVVDRVDVEDVNLIRINIFSIQSKRKMLPNKIVIQQKILLFNMYTI